jgi:adenosylmethionine-8-amino-7-oxononanoate aminotransferase
MEFRAKLELNGKTATGFEVPEKIVTGLGAGKKPAVRVTINGHTYRSTVATMGGRFMVGVSADNRALASVAAGDTVDVELDLDSAPREVTVPPDLARALKRDAAAKRCFDGLSYSKQRGLVEPIEAAKTDETRQRRIDKAITTLREGRV